MHKNYCTISELHEKYGLRFGDLTIEDLSAFGLFTPVEDFGSIIPTEESNASEQKFERVHMTGMLKVEPGILEDVFYDAKNTPAEIRMGTQLEPTDCRICESTKINGHYREDLIDHPFEPENHYLRASSNNIYVPYYEQAEYLNKKYGLGPTPDPVEKAVPLYSTPLLEVQKAVIKKFWADGAPEGPQKKDVVVNWIMDNYDHKVVNKSIAHAIDTIVRSPDQKKKQPRPNKNS